MRSNSWSDSLDDCHIVPALEINRTLLGDSQKQLYDTYKRSYAEMLYRWGLLVPRAKILKYLSVNVDIFRDVEFVTECVTCGKVTIAPTCRECHKSLLNCSLCRLPVRGLANACLNCGHGGHSDHMQKWFEVSPHRQIMQFIWLILPVCILLLFFSWRETKCVQPAVDAYV